MERLQPRPAGCRRGACYAQIEGLEQRTLLAVLTVAGGDFAGLMRAYGSSSPGDTIVLGAGTFEGNLAWMKDVNLRGSGPGQTVLKGLPSAKAAVLHVEGVENARFSDLTLTGGLNGGVVIINASPVLSNMAITDNIRETAGGGLYVYGDSNPVILDSLIEGNSHYTGQGHWGGWGGGVYYDGGAEGLIAWTTIRGNYAWASGNGMYLAATVRVDGVVVEGNGGDGIAVGGGAPVIENSLVTGNGARGITVLGVGGEGSTIRFNTIANNGSVGVSVAEGASARVTGSIITGHDHAGIEAHGTVQVSRNDVWGNAVNYWGPMGPDAYSISADPRLDASYVPLPGSPVIDAGPPDTLDLDITRSDLGHTGGRGTQAWGPYRLDTLLDPQTGNTEHRLRKDGFHFATMQKTPQGGVGFRPHPDRDDANGWGSTRWNNPFIAGGDAVGGRFVDLIATPKAIYAKSEGRISRSAGGWFGTFTVTEELQYDAVEQRVRGRGSLQISLDGTLAQAGGDLNVFRISSNRLVGVPLQTGGVGQTGDMCRVDVRYNQAGGPQDFGWVPESQPAHFPQEQSDYLWTRVVGARNLVDGGQLGVGAIAIARKPTMTHAITAHSSAYSARFGGMLDQGRTQDPFADNVGVVGWVHQTSTASTQMRFEVEYEAETVANQAPVVSSLSVSPSPATQKQQLVLRASDVSDQDGSVMAVRFYRDSNGNGVLDMGTDLLLATDTTSADGWRCSVAASTLPVGQSRYFARAKDDEQRWSSTATGTVTIQPVVRAGPLQVDGTDLDDVISVSLSSGVLTVVKNGQSISYSGVTALTIMALGGNDTVVLDLSTTLAATIAGATGNDTITGGAGADLLKGGGGSDLIYGKAQADTIKGGGGSDDLRGNGGADSLVGGAGSDTLRGNGGKDTLSGGGLADMLVGGGGDDWVYVRDGAADTVVGGAAWDRVQMDDGGDQVSLVEELLA